MSIAHIAVLSDELSRAAARLEQRESVADALRVTDSFDRICRLRPRVEDPEDAADVDVLIEDLRPLAELCRQQLQAELASPDTLDGLRAAFDTAIEAHAADPDADPGAIVVLAEDLFRVAGACAWLTGDALEEARDAVEEAATCLGTFPATFLAMTPVADRRADEELGPEDGDADAIAAGHGPPAVLWSLLQLCSSLPFVELGDRILAAKSDDARSVVAPGDAGPAPDNLVQFRPSATQPDPGFAIAHLAMAADDGIDRATDPDRWTELSTGEGWHLAGQLGPVSETGQRELWLELVLDAPPEALPTDVTATTGSGTAAPVRARVHPPDTLLIQVACAQPFLLQVSALSVVAWIDPRTLATE